MISPLKVACCKYNPEEWPGPCILGVLSKLCRNQEPCEGVSSDTTHPSGSHHLGFWTDQGPMDTGRLCSPAGFTLHLHVCISKEAGCPISTPDAKKTAVNWSQEDLTRRLFRTKPLGPFVPSIIPCEGPELLQTALPFLRPLPF